MSLDVNGITKHFHDARRGTFAAVSDVSFSCKSGEIMGLLGPNGAGKTTILRMISTLLTPDSGGITVDGFSTIKQAEEVRKRLGFLSSDTGVYEKLTPREILTFFARVSKYKGGEIKQRVNTVLKTFQLDTFSDICCDKLSSGMRQKVSIARAVVHDPPLIALDEPTNSLDILGIKATHNFIVRCKQEGKCVVLSTHLIYEAEKLCDRIAILHEGKILALGTLSQLREQTGQRYLEEIFTALIPQGSNELV